MKNPPTSCPKRSPRRQKKRKRSCWWWDCRKTWTAPKERAPETPAPLLRALTGLETVMQDERGTTVTAHGYLNETNTRGKKRKNVVDAVAATIMLQDYLDKRKNS